MGVFNMKRSSVIILLLKLKVHKDNPTSEITSPNTQTPVPKDVALSCDFLTLSQNVFPFGFFSTLKKQKTFSFLAVTINGNGSNCLLQNLFFLIIYLSVILLPKSPGSPLYFAPFGSFELCVIY